MSTDSGKALHSILQRIRTAPHQTVRALRIWPLVCEAHAPPLRAGGSRIATLAQALEDGFVSVDERCASRERGDASGVRVVRIGNRACDPVLIMFCEELHAESGALIAEASVLLPPTSELEIGVHPRDSHREGSRDDPAAYCSSVGKIAEFGEFRDGFRLVERQVGFVAAIAGEIVGLEVMSDAEIFARSFETLLRPYALDARGAGIARRRAAAVLDPQFVTPEPFLAALETSRTVVGPTAGLGRGLRVVGPGLAGCALEAGEIVHLTAYPLEVASAA